MVRKSIMVQDYIKDQLDDCSIAVRRDTYENIIAKLIEFYNKNKDLVESYYKNPPMTKDKEKTKS